MPRTHPVLRLFGSRSTAVVQLYRCTARYRTELPIIVTEISRCERSRRALQYCRDGVHLAIHDWPSRLRIPLGGATVQIGQLELSPHLPTLDALDAEFGWDDAARRRIHGGAPMDSTFSPTQSELPTHQGVARPTLDATTRPSLDAIIKRPSLGRRASRGIARFLVVFCSGVAATLAWQLYSDTARAMIANSSPQLGWLAPQTAPVAQTAPEVVTPTAADSPDLQPLALGLASIHQSIDQLAAQLAADQRQMGGDIAKLQADELEILHKLSATPLRPAAAPTPKPAPVTPPPLPSGPAR